MKELKKLYIIKDLLQDATQEEGFLKGLYSGVEPLLKQSQHKNEDKEKLGRDVYTKTIGQLNIVCGKKYGNPKMWTELSRLWLNAMDEKGFVELGSEVLKQYEKSFRSVEGQEGNIKHIQSSSVKKEVDPQKMGLAISVTVNKLLLPKLQDNFMSSGMAEAMVDKFDNVEEGKKEIDNKYHTLLESVHPILLTDPKAIKSIIKRLDNNDKVPYPANEFYKDAVKKAQSLLKKDKTLGFDAVRSYLNSPFGEVYLGKKLKGNVSNEGMEKEKEKENIIKPLGKWERVTKQIQDIDLEKIDKDENMRKNFLFNVKKIYNDGENKKLLAPRSKKEDFAIQVIKESSSKTAPSKLSKLSSTSEMGNFRSKILEEKNKSVPVISTDQQTDLGKLPPPLPPKPKNVPLTKNPVKLEKRKSFGEEVKKEKEHKDKDTEKGGR